MPHSALPENHAPSRTAQVPYGCAINGDIRIFPQLAHSGGGPFLRPVAEFSGQGGTFRFTPEWTDLARLSRPGDHHAAFRSAPPVFPGPRDCPASSALVRTLPRPGAMRWTMPLPEGELVLEIRAGQFEEQAGQCLMRAREIARVHPGLRLFPSGIRLMDLLFMDIPGRPDRLRIVSGGQTGVDRAALDAALELGLPCSGWCPRGRRAEDGRIPEQYPLMETPKEGYADRTRRNVDAADGTLILAMGPLSGGTRFTLRTVREHARNTERPHPCLTIGLDGLCPSPEMAMRWIRESGLAILNVAGPREQKAPGAYAAALNFLRNALRPFSPDADSQPPAPYTPR